MKWAVKGTGWKRVITADDPDLRFAIMFSAEHDAWILAILYKEWAGRDYHEFDTVAHAKQAAEYLANTF